MAEGAPEGQTGETAEDVPEGWTAGGRLSVPATGGPRGNSPCATFQRRPVSVSFIL